MLIQIVVVVVQSILIVDAEPNPPDCAQCDQLTVG